MCSDEVPRRVFAFFRRAAKEGRSRRSETSPVHTPVPAAAGNPPGLCGFAARFCNLFPVPSPPAGLFLCRQRKRRKKPLKGTYFEAVPLRIPPRRPRGLRPPLDSPLLDGGRGFTKDEGQGCPPQRSSVPRHCHSRCAHRLRQSVSPSKLPSPVYRLSSHVLKAKVTTKPTELWRLLQVFRVLAAGITGATPKLFPGICTNSGCTKHKRFPTARTEFVIRRGLRLFLAFLPLIYFPNMVDMSGLGRRIGVR